MTCLDIAQEKFKELDERTPLEYVTDKIPIVGYHLKLERLKGKRRDILKGLEKDISGDSYEVNMINKLMVAHNQENINDALGGHYLFGALCGVGGLIGIGYALGSYFAN